MINAHKHIPGTIKFVHASPKPVVDIWDEASIDLTAFLQSKGLSVTDYTVYAVTLNSIGYTNADEETPDPKIHIFKLDDIKAFQMKQKESIMPREDFDVLDCLESYTGSDTHGTVAAAIKKINEFKAAGKPFVIIFQPGAGAPVADMMTEWKQAGLAGCTGELVACKTALAGANVIVINTMTPAEQLLAHDAVKNAKNVDVSGMTFINDPEKLFIQLFEMNDLDKTQVRDRVAYRPQALVCDSLSKVMNVIRNETVKAGEPRESAAYLERIQKALQILAQSKDNFPPSYRMLRESRGAAADARASSSGSNAPSRK